MSETDIINVDDAPGIAVARLLPASTSQLSGIFTAAVLSDNAVPLADTDRNPSAIGLSVPVPDAPIGFDDRSYGPWVPLSHLPIVMVLR
ncbi:MAG: hypothetical protein IIT89_04580 [Aeriscardovia sp.]|nr:hypothetical protein [Aeriscardovia sp.]